MNYKFISIVIPALNEEKFIEKAILSLQNQDYPKEFFEIITVDNGSEDQTFNIARINKVHKLIRVIEKGTNHARDAGWRQAKGEIVAFLDADCVAPANWLEKINNHFQTQPNLSLLCGRYDFPNMPFFPRKIANFVTRYLSPKIVSITDFVFRKKGVLITGGNFAVSKKTLENIVCFNTDLSLIGDDVNTGLRVVRAGKIWKYDPELIVETSLRRFQKNGHLKQNINLLQSYYREYFKAIL